MLYCEKKHMIQMLLGPSLPRINMLRFAINFGVMVTAGSGQVVTIEPITPSWMPAQICSKHKLLGVSSLRQGLPFAIHYTTAM